MHEYNDVDKDGAVTWDEYVKVTYTDDKGNHKRFFKKLDPLRPKI